MTSHDQLWKDLFRIFFPDLLFLLDSDLANHLVGKLGPGGFTFLDKEVFHDLPEGERREVDLLAEIPDRAGGRKFRIHVEIEGSFSGKIARRVARYSHHLYLRQAGPVVSIVVFLHGGPPGARWTDYVERAFGREIHRFNYLSFGLSKLPAQTLLDRPEPLAWALASLTRPGKMGRALLKLELLRKIATAPVGEVERFLLVNSVETYLQLAGREAEKYAALRLVEENPEVEAMETTWAERQAAEYQKKFFEEGIEKGIEKGREEGRGQGVERLRSTLLRQLGQRFGPVSPVIRGRVEAIDSLDELGGLVDRILEVTSIEELGLAS
ncbi:MAG TPA: hypothetical protein VGS22_17125 [Thermoanaerobaculia bacterium]|jgi:hypothetical protein|nr:hypothetical protein [Thermoanaerobaculia bacterium]